VVRRGLRNRGGSEPSAANRADEKAGAPPETPPRNAALGTRQRHDHMKRTSRRFRPGRLDSVVVDVPARYFRCAIAFELSVTGVAA